MEALDKAPKPITRPNPLNEENLHASLDFNDSFRSNDDPIPSTTGLTCHSTPSKRQWTTSNGRSRSHSLPLNDKARRKWSTHFYSYNRCNSLESDLEFGYGNNFILREKRVEFERRRRQVNYRATALSMFTYYVALKL